MLVSRAAWCDQKSNYLHNWASTNRRSPPQRLSWELWEGMKCREQLRGPRTRKVGRPTRDRKAWGDGSAVAMGREFPEERVPHSLRWERPFGEMLSLVVATVQGVQKIEGGKWSGWWTQPWISLGEKARGRGCASPLPHWLNEDFLRPFPFWELSRFRGYTRH